MRVAPMFFAVAAVISGPAGAQRLVPDTPAANLSYDFRSAARASEGDPLRPSLETPTMRRQKLAQALMLRDEAQALLARDGGRLTAGHVRYIRSRSRAILSNGDHRFVGTGSLVPHGER